jgi:hypothetical protein
LFSFSSRISSQWDTLHSLTWFPLVTLSTQNKYTTMPDFFRKFLACGEESKFRLAPTVIGRLLPNIPREKDFQMLVFGWIPVIPLS